MPSTEADANKQALLDTLRAKKPLGTAASTNAKQEAHTNPPSRARDATGLLISRHFAGPSSAFHTNRPSGKVLVPNSSPIAPSTRPSSEYVPKMGHHGGSPGPSASTTSLVFRGKLMQQEIRSLGRKPALVPPSATASSSRSSSVRRRDDEDTSDSEARPRKRANNTSSSSPVDFDPLSSPIHGPGVGAVKFGVKEMQIDSSPLQPNGRSSPGKPRRRLVRGRRISSDDEESTPSPLISPKVENQEIKRTEAKPPIPPRTGPITVVRVTEVPVRIDKVKEQTVPFTRPTSLPTTTIKSHTKPTSPTKPQLKPKPKLVDIDSGSDLSSFDDDDESLDEADLQRIELALVYFNEASAEKLIEINGEYFYFSSCLLLTPRTLQRAHKRRRRL
ncbi:uncharacterized protein EI90DRAFT_1908238 [Cantharellus anzutake]|uniref:uncharacterized protein n=1 Tax=Cantharellus anzutake TaxID=1750568 RepID=UPI0019043AB8|nr:uncharacterized protein EI90DRAFT_1908238 [Cantharellus anzutake]KAF8326572.1 hypothetical protein EI90DRAFT_1908238 [Cantharellus anzutake]